MTFLRAAALAALIFALCPLAKADPVKIRADWNIIPGQFAPLIPTVPHYAPDVYRHYGKSYVVEPLHLAGGGATLTALAVGETDLSTLSPQALVLGVTTPSSICASSASRSRPRCRAICKLISG